MDRSLGRLPQELRNRIYELVLISPEPIVLVSNAAPWVADGPNVRPRDNPSGSNVGFLRTCKAAHAEAKVISLEANTFVVQAAPHTAMSQLRVFLRGSMPSQSLRLLRRVKVELGTVDRDSLKGLRTGLVDFSQYAFTHRKQWPDCEIVLAFSFQPYAGGDEPPLCFELLGTSKQGLGLFFSNCAAQITRVEGAHQQQLHASPHWSTQDITDALLGIQLRFFRQTMHSARMDLAKKYKEAGYLA